MISLFGADGFNQGLLSSAGNIASSALSYKANKRLIQMQQNWQEKMSNTAHQREVADLRAAGLNPILSATGGSGASFGSASAPGMSFDNPVDSGLNSAISWKQQKNRDKLTSAQKNDLEASAYLKGNQANTESERFNTQIEQTREIQNNIINNRAITAAQVDNLKKQGDAALINANANVINARANSARSVADIKYTNERSRGYSRTESGSTSSGGNYNVLHVLSHGKNKSSSYSNSISW